MVHYTMGGLSCTPSGQVLDKKGNVMPGMDMHTGTLAYWHACLLARLPAGLLACLCAYVLRCIPLINAALGLFAAGEIIGGIHGDNRLGGSRLVRLLELACTHVSHG